MHFHFKPSFFISLLWTLLGFCVTYLSAEQSIDQSNGASSQLYCPKMDAQFSDAQGKQIRSNQVTVIFAGTRTDGQRVWTGEAWVEKGQLLPPELAIKHYSELINAGTTDGEVYRRRAAIYRHRGEPLFALLDYGRAIQLDPQSALAFAGRGIVFRTQGSLDRALDDLNRAVELLPNFPAVRIARGNVYSDQGEHQKAVEAYREAAKLDEGSFLAHKNLAAELYVLKDFKNAIESYDRAFAINKDPAILHDRALVFSAIKDYAKAERDLKQGLEATPGNVRLVSTLAIVHAAAGAQNEALKRFEESLASEPRNPMHWHNRGIMRLNQREYSQSLSDFRKALELDPLYVPSLIACTRLLASTPDGTVVNGNEAIVMGMRALQATRFRNSAAYSAMANAYAARDSFDDAVRCQRSAIELLKNDPDLKRSLEQELNSIIAKKKIGSVPQIDFET